MRTKLYPSADEALRGLLWDGMSIMSGGFGLSGNPEHLIAAVKRSDVKQLTVMSGARLVLTALHQLEKIGGKRALVTMCVGVGQGVALAIERV